MIDRVVVGGIATARVTRSQLADIMVEDSLAARQAPGTSPKLLISSNGSVIARYHLNVAFREMVKKADLIDADGMPLVIASRIFCNRPLTERVATTDFIHDAAAAALKHQIRFYFLGGAAGVAEAAAERLRTTYEGLQIVGVRDGYFAPDDEAEICADIRRTGADVLWLGLGSPKQEQFALRNAHQLGGLAWIKTCGGLFDHFTGRTARAPVWMQNIGLEWLARAVQEPRRLAMRYLWSNPVATYYLATQTFDTPPAEELVTL